MTTISRKGVVMRNYRDLKPILIITVFMLLFISGCQTNRDSFIAVDTLTPLQALKDGQFEEARLLIEKGADFNAVNNKGWTALMLALRYEQPENAKLLVEKGADLTAADNKEWTALMLALRYEQPENAKLLIEKGTDVRISPNAGITPLMIAEQYNYNDIVDLLEQKIGDE
jgi:ankyrin repeat protein